MLIVRLEAKKSPGRRQARGAHSMEKMVFRLLMSLGWLMDRASISWGKKQVWDWHVLYGEWAI